MDDHQVVRDDAEPELLASRRVGPGPQGGTQLPLVLGKGALDVHPVAVDALEESAPHLSPIRLFGPRPASPGVYGDDGRANAQDLATQPVVSLTVVGRVSQESVEREVLGRLQDRRGEPRGVVPRSPAEGGSRPQVAGGVADDGQFGPEALFEASRLGSMVDVVLTDVPNLEPRGVQGPFGGSPNQVAGSGLIENSSKKSLDAPFFIRRFCAFSRVVQ